MYIVYGVQSQSRVCEYIVQVHRSSTMYKRYTSYKYDVYIVLVLDYIISCTHAHLQKVYCVPCTSYDVHRTRLCTYMYIYVPCDDRTYSTKQGIALVQKVQHYLYIYIHSTSYIDLYIYKVYTLVHTIALLELLCTLYVCVNTQLSCLPAKTFETLLVAPYLFYSSCSRASSSSYEMLLPGTR